MVSASQRPVTFDFYVRHLTQAPRSSIERPAWDAYLSPSHLDAMAAKEAGLTDFDDKEIDIAVSQGKKNQETARLIKNWCAHARIDRFGGVGLIEKMSGAPIGHHGVQCDHAPAGGMYCWSLEDAALDFYEKNCKSCEKRSPVSTPDLQPLIDKYNAKEAERQREKEAEETTAAQELARRCAERQNLRNSNDQNCCHIIDLLDSIDGNMPDGAAEKLFEMARLSPESFHPGIVDYLALQVTGNAPRLATPSCAALVNLNIDPELKTQLAVETIQRFSSNEEVIRFISENTSRLNETQIGHLLPAFAALAQPHHVIGDCFDRRNPTPLLILAKSHTDTLVRQIRTLYADPREENVDLAVRILATIIPDNPQIAPHFIHDTTALLLRHRMLLPRFAKEYMEDSLPILRDAASAIFQVQPERTDSYMQSLLLHADATAFYEAASLYSRVLDRPWSAPPIEPNPVALNAFRRLLWLAMKVPEVPPDDPAKHFFSHVNRGLEPLAASEIDSLLGSAAILDTRLVEFDRHNAATKAESPLETLERSTQRSMIVNLLEGLVRWAIAGTKHQGADGIRNLLNFLDGLPESGGIIRYRIIAQLSALISSPSDINLILPHIYAAMTSTDTIARGSVAKAIGETDRKFAQDYPDLIYQMYVVLLSDSYVYVHKSAVRALKVAHFPENCGGQIRFLLQNLIILYSKEGKDQSFVVDCLKKYVQSFVTPAQMSGSEGNSIFGIIGKLDDMEAADVAGALRYYLADSPYFVPLVARLLQSDWAQSVGRQDLFRLLRNVPADRLRDGATELCAAALELADEPLYTSATLVGLVAKAGCWQQAADCCDALLARIPDTVNRKAQRDHLLALRHACAFEANLPVADADLRHTEEAWREILALLAKRHERRL